MVQTNSQMAIFCQEINIVELELGFILLNCWPKRFNGKTQTTQAVTKDIGSSLQTDSKNPLINEQLWKLLGMEKWSLHSTFTLTLSHLRYREVFCRLPKYKNKHQTYHQNKKISIKLLTKP